MMMTKKEKKRVPELRFTGFEGEWERKVLGKRCLKIGDGLHGTPKYVDDSGIYFINGNNIVSGKIEIYENTKQVSEKVYKKNEKEINENTLLISINGTIGNIGWYNNEPVMLGKSVGYLTFPEKPSFEFHYLNTSKAQRFFVSQLTGTTIKNLSLKTLRETSIYIPQLEEQQKIATFLTSIDTRIQQLEKKKTLLEQYKKGVMQKIFKQEIRFRRDDGEEFGEWEKKSVSEMFRVTRGNVLSMTKVSDFNEGEYMYPVYSSQTKNGGLSGFYNEYLYENALTWTTDGANAGDVNYRTGKFYCTNVCGVLLSDEGYANTFIAEKLNSITRKYVSYVGNPKLMNGVMSEIVIEVPSIPEQTKIAHFLSSLDTKIAVIEQQIVGMKEWKKGVLQRMFV